MSTELIRRYRCDNCGQVEELPEPADGLPEGWFHFGGPIGLLCDVCKGVALAALKTRERAEVQ